jgi:hypothetical protein
MEFTLRLRFTIRHVSSLYAANLLNFIVRLKLEKLLFPFRVKNTERVIRLPPEVNKRCAANRYNTNNATYLAISEAKERHRRPENPP